MLPAKFGAILPSSFREDFFKQQPIRNKNCPWWPYLLVERNEMEKLYGGPYIDAYCQVWLHFGQLVSEEKTLTSGKQFKKNFYYVRTRLFAEQREWPSSYDCIVLGKGVCQTFIYGYIVTKYGCNCLKYIFPKEVCIILHSTYVFMKNFGCEVKYNQNLGQMVPASCW